MKKPKLDERTQKALETISCGDMVKFYDCFEAIVYGDTKFRVISEHPIIQNERYVFVKLQHLGLFPIGRLKKVEDPFTFSDEEIRKGLVCCTLDENCKNCEECPYKILGKPNCHAKVTTDSSLLVKRINAYYSERAEVQQ